MCIVYCVNYINKCTQIDFIEYEWIRMMGSIYNQVVDPYRHQISLMFLQPMPISMKASMHFMR